MLSHANFLANAMAVSEVIEPFLLRAGLLMKSDQGQRELTTQGRNHLSSLRQESV